MTGDVTDGVKRCRTDLAGPFGNLVDHGEQLIRLVVQHPVEIAKMPAAHMPMKVLGFDKEREDVGEQMAERFTDFIYALL